MSTGRTQAGAAPGIDARRDWLERAEALSRGMLSAAEAGDWQRVQSLEGERRRLVEDAFAEPVGETERVALERPLRRLAELNDRLLERAAAARDEAAGSAHQAHTAARAVDAYAACGGA